MDFVHGCEREGLSNYAHERNVVCSARLLAAIEKHHGVVVEQVEPEAEPVREAAAISSPQYRPIPPKRIRKEPVRPIELGQAFNRAWKYLEGPFQLAGKVELIQRAVLTYYPFTINDMKSIRRTAAVCRARQVAMYLVKEMTDLSLPMIGRRFGGRDHTTVIHSVRKIAHLVNTDPAFAAHINEIRNFIVGNADDLQHSEAENSDPVQGAGAQDRQPEHLGPYPA